MTDTFLAKPLVVELGDRLAVGLCGGLLQRLGAEVVVVELAVGQDASARIEAISPVGACCRQAISAN